MASYFRRLVTATASSLLGSHHPKNILGWTTTTARNIPSSLRSQQQPPPFLISSAFLQQRFMSKRLSKSATKRIPLTTKRTTKMGFNKGKGGTKEGRLNEKGRFILDPLKRMELMVPDLTGFKLKPYVANVVPKLPPEKRTKEIGAP